MKSRNSRRLQVSIHDAPPEDSFIADGDVFIKNNIAINANGVAMRNNPKTFTLEYNELDIGDTIGRGCSSVVLHGLHNPTGTPLALKVINLFDKSKRDQLIREISTLYDAQCPSLITFYGSFYREGSITLALEFMDGGSLANVISQVGPIPEDVLASMAFQILWGLAYLHHEKRVHRDIKPSNLLINSEGQVKVTDFGVAAELQSTFAMCGTFVGTFKYMSPERIRNQPYSYQSDIWSFGLVLFECATGRYPYDECSNCIDMAQTILDCEIPSLPRQYFGEEFIQFIDLCLKKNPKHRPPAEVLLTAPWIVNQNIASYDDAVNNVNKWITGLSRK